MARFLVAVWPFPSHYYPLVAIGHALRERGHEVAFFTGARARDTLVGEGFQWFGFEKVDDERVDRLLFSRESYASWRSPLRLRALLREWLLGTVPAQLEDLGRVLRAWRPDVIVSETSMWSPMLVVGEAEGM